MGINFDLRIISETFFHANSKISVEYP